MTKSVQVSNFTSKFRRVTLRANYTMTVRRAWPATTCSTARQLQHTCHRRRERDDPEPRPGGTPAQPRTANPPVFTCFVRSANEGVIASVIPGMLSIIRPQPDSFGFIGEILNGFGYRDLGIGNFPAKWFSVDPAPYPNRNLDTICTNG